MPPKYSWPNLVVLPFLVICSSTGCDAGVPGGDEIVDPWHAVAPCDLLEGVDSLIESRIEASQEANTTDSAFAGVEYGGAVCKPEDVPSLTVLVAVDLVDSPDEQKLYYQVQGDPTMNTLSVFKPAIPICGGSLEVRVRGDESLLSDIQRDLASGLTKC